LGQYGCGQTVARWFMIPEVLGSIPTDGEIFLRPFPELNCFNLLLITQDQFLKQLTAIFALEATADYVLASS